MQMVRIPSELALVNLLLAETLGGEAITGIGGMTSVLGCIVGTILVAFTATPLTSCVCGGVP
eukprot:9303959-Prorocentrum_lima.AAC.1